MKQGLPFPRSARLILGTAALLVPPSRRDDWTREWEAELWHICNTGAGGRAPALREILSFTAGCFPDAWWIRRDLLRAQPRVTLQQASAPRCAALLAAWILAGLTACTILPGARQALLSASFPAGSDLVTLSAHGFAGTQFPTIRLATYRGWQTETRSLFSGIAFYRVSAKRVRISGSPAAHITLALGTPDLLQLLKMGPSQIGRGSSGTPGEAQLFLTRTAWKHMEGAGAELNTRSAEVAGEPVHLGGILADDHWRLPGGVQGVLLETPEMLRSLPDTTRGFVIASTAHPGAMRRSWTCLIDRTGPSDKYYACIRLSYLENEPIAVFLLTLLLAVISLPATTPLQLGEFPRTSCRLSWRANLRRWSFLAIKFLLAAASIGIWSVALAYGLFAVSLSTSIYLQLIMGFPALLFAFRWVLRDQRSRCPDCLRLLSNPARVGQPSCNFLSWNGTELICTVGHGLLHIPELPTSWCSTQRWLSLDSSWLCLFRENSAAIAEGT